MEILGLDCPELFALALVNTTHSAPSIYYGKSTYVRMITRVVVM
jgi:hypothetical protein